MKKTVASIIGTAWISGALFLVAGFPESSLAEVYRWEDDSGVIHFTDTPSDIPAKYRSRKKLIMQGPPASGQPSFSTMGAPTPVPSAPTPPDRHPETQSPSAQPENGSADANQLRSRITAKEKFIEGIDIKRSNILNPMGNRFVSPEDLELYKKYTEELPKDREQLKSIDTAAP